MHAKVIMDEDGDGPLSTILGKFHNDDIREHLVEQLKGELLPSSFEAAARLPSRLS